MMYPWIKRGVKATTTGVAQWVRHMLMAWFKKNIVGGPIEHHAIAKLLQQHIASSYT